MGTIVLHAGMPKAGSSTIQQWIQDQHRWLRDELGWHLLLYRRGTDLDTRGQLTSYVRGGVNSASFVRRYNRRDRTPAILDELFEPLDQLADELGSVLLTGEGFSRLFAEPDAPFLERLEWLAARHRVRVAYYVRAQHESIEAAWRQWGFRQKWRPRGYVELRERFLDYHATRQHVSEIAPSVSFDVRLFHREVLRETSIIEDFVRTFLDAGDTTFVSGEIWANPGLPLELVNVLRYAEPGRFWTSAHDNTRIKPLKANAAGWKLVESPSIHRSRLVLQHHCHARFEAGNRALAQELAWPVDGLVPAVDDADFTFNGLGELNDLWASTASEAEREIVFLALESLLAAEAQSEGAS
jgi:hypothetical protein